MYRKGYPGEKFVRAKILVPKYGKNNVLKIAIGGAQDYMIVKSNSNEILKIVEVKETIQDKYYPNKKDKIQFERIKKFSEEHNVPAELYIVYRKGRGKPTIIEKKEL